MIFRIHPHHGGHAYAEYEFAKSTRFDDKFPAYSDETIAFYTTLARISLKRSRDCIARSPCASFVVVHAHAKRWKGLLTKLSPLLEELFSGNV